MCKMKKNLIKRMEAINHAINSINNDSKQMRIDIETIYDRQRVNPLLNKNKRVVKELTKMYIEYAKKIKN